MVQYWQKCKHRLIWAIFYANIGQAVARTNNIVLFAIKEPLKMKRKSNRKKK